MEKILTGDNMLFHVDNDLHYIHLLFDTLQIQRHILGNLNAFMLYTWLIYQIIHVLHLKVGDFPTKKRQSVPSSAMKMMGKFGLPNIFLTPGQTVD